MKVLEKQSQKWLKKRAWLVFSKFIRKRDKKCFTCGADTTQAGHWRHGHTKAGFFDPRNIRGQCTKCNLYLSGNGQVYSLRMAELYGLEEANKMWKEFSKDHNWTRRELIEIIKTFEKEIDKLDN
jgi:hypothetical protein